MNNKKNKKGYILAYCSKLNNMWMITICICLVMVTSEDLKCFHILFLLQRSKKNSLLLYHANGTIKRRKITFNNINQ